MPNQLYVYHPHPSAYLFVGLDDNSIGLRHKKGSLCKSQKKHNLCGEKNLNIYMVV